MTEHDAQSDTESPRPCTDGGETIEQDEADVADLPDEDIIRVFTIKLAEYHNANDYSRKKCIFDVAREFRDEHQVNILRVLKRNGFVHPDGYRFNIKLEGGKELLQIYDPVVPEAKEEGGTADFRAGDVIEHDGDGLVILAVGETHVAAMNKSGEVMTHALATVRNLFSTRRYDARLIRDGKVIRE